jgi:hypothetical protein
MVELAIPIMVIFALLSAKWFGRSGFTSNNKMGLKIIPSK